MVVPVTKPKDTGRTAGQHAGEEYPGSEMGVPLCHPEGDTHQEVWIHERDLSERFGMRYGFESQ